MDTDTQVLDPAIIDPMVIEPNVLEPAATETISPVVESPLDSITGTESGSGSSSNTSNGNQVAVNSTFDHSTHNTFIYSYSSNESYSSNQNQETLYNGMGQTNSESQLEDGFLCGTSEASGSLSLSRRHRFDSRQYFRGLRRRSRVDRITNFNGDAGDTLELSKRIFKGMGSLDFVAVGSKRGRNRAAKTDSDIIYEQFSGRLYFNANSEEKGFGTKGGLFAIFETAPVLGSSDFIIV